MGLFDGVCYFLLTDNKLTVGLGVGEKQVSDQGNLFMAFVRESERAREREREKDRERERESERERWSERERERERERKTERERERKREVE